MKYFSIRELTKSATATRLGIDNTAKGAVLASLTTLINCVLDPLRERWGAPIVVTSGYRCAALNKVVGGAASSQHTKGEAADIRSLSDSRADNMRLLRLLLGSDIEFDQVICEYPDNDGRPDWIHVSYKASGRNRRSMLTARRVGGVTKYYNGINV